MQKQIRNVLALSLVASTNSTIAVAWMCQGT